MASLNLSAAVSTLTSGPFLKSAVLIVAGSLATAFMTDFMRSNVYDVTFAGGDAAYAGITALLALAILPGRYGRPMALGSAATAVRVVVEQFGLL